MKRLSSVAAIACVGIISIGLTGCGGGGGGGSTANAPAIQAATADEPCPIPAEVQNPITIDDADNFSGTRDVIAYTNKVLSIGEVLEYGLHPRYRGAKVKDESSLMSLIRSKAMLLGRGLGDFYPELAGDDIKCGVNEGDGKYSMHQEAVESDGISDGIQNETEKVAVRIEFDNCRVSGNDEIIEMFYDIVRTAKVVQKANWPNPDTSEYLLNGSVQIEQENSISYSIGSKTEQKDEEIWKLHIVTSGLEGKEINTENNQTSQWYTSNGDILMEVTMGEVASKVKTYDNENNEKAPDTNYTIERKSSKNGEWRIAMNFSEEAFIVDANASIAFNALCFEATGTASSQNNSLKSYDATTDTSTMQRTTERKRDGSADGYLAFQVTRDGEFRYGEDMYGNGLKVAFDENGIFEDESVEKNGTFSIDGTVGSMALGKIVEDDSGEEHPEGGSVTFNTMVPWKFSWSGNRNLGDNFPVLWINPFKLLIGEGYSITPYEGHTTISGTNTVDVTFDGNATEQNITVTDGDLSATYSSLPEMIYGGL